MLLLSVGASGAADHVPRARLARRIEPEVLVVTGVVVSVPVVGDVE
ncbi:MAG: hypothetical protein ACXWVM_44065 [Polyangiales bacterium]